MSENVALIPLRGGSKGIPNKNINDLCGKPLCKWSIEAALGVKNIDKVYVSTESKVIKDLVLSFNLGVEVIDRPKSLATDEATTDSVLAHFAKKVNFKNLITIQATSPLVSSKSIYEALNLFLLNKYDSLLSISRTKQFLWSDNFKPLNYDPSNRPRRQDFDGFAVENGAFYITKKEIIENLETRLAGNIGFYEMAVEDSFEIDNKLDLEIIKSIMKFKGMVNE